MKQPGSERRKVRRVIPDQVLLEEETKMFEWLDGDPSDEKLLANLEEIGKWPPCNDEED
jgi:hypothetical protein